MTQVSRVLAGGFSVGGCVLVLFSMYKLTQELSFIYAPNYTGSWAGLTWLISLIAILVGALVMAIGEYGLRKKIRATTFVLSGALGWIVLTCIIIFNIISIPETALYIFGPVSIAGPPLLLWVHQSD